MKLTKKLRRAIIDSMKIHADPERWHDDCPLCMGYDAYGWIKVCSVEPCSACAVVHVFGMNCFGCSNASREKNEHAPFAIDVNSDEEEQARHDQCVTAAALMLAVLEEP